MTVAKNVLNRIHVQRLLFAAALLGVSLSVTAHTRSHQQATGQAIWSAAVNGKTTTVGGMQQGQSRVYGPYNPSTVNGAGDVVLSTGGKIPVNGSSVPGTVSGTISKGDIAGAALAAAACLKGGVAGAVICGGGAIAIPLALEWMSKAGIRINPTTKALEKQGDSLPQSDGWKYRLVQTQVEYYTKGAACQAAIAYGRSVYPQWGERTFTVTQCQTGSGEVHIEVDPSPGYRLGYSIEQTGGSPCPAGQYVKPDGSCSATNDAAWSGVNIEDATGLMNNSRIPSGEIVKELDRAGQADKMPAKDIQVTGPASVQGPSTTTTNNVDNSVKTTTTTNNYTYNTNTVTNTSTVTNTQTTSSTGQTTQSETTTATPGEQQPSEPEPDKSECEKSPDTLGCAELDTPEGEIPRQNKEVTFQVEDVLGGGQCPADVTTTLGTLGGRSVKIVDWATFCGMAVPLRGLVIALASIMAFFIIMPGGVRE